MQSHDYIAGSSGVDAWSSAAEAAWLLWAMCRQRCYHHALVYMQEGGVTTSRGRL